MASPWVVTATKAKGQGDGEAREIPAEGAHPAAVVALVNMGTRPKKYEDSGKEVMCRRVYIVWELTDAPMSGTRGRNHVLSKEYVLSFSDKSGLRKLVEDLGKKFQDGEQFDLLKLLGRKCIANVVHAKSGAGYDYAKIASVTPLPPGYAPPGPLLKPFSWQLGDGDEHLPDWLPWLMGRPVRDWLAECQERKRDVAELRAAVGLKGRPAQPAARPAPQQSEAERLAAAATAGTEPEEIPW